MRRKPLLLVMLLLALGAPLARAQKDAGKPYGARDPKTCASRKAPENGAISAGQAAEYVACGYEGIDGFGSLVQVANVKVEVAKGRAFNINLDSNLNVDSSRQVYPILGSFTLGYCRKLGVANQGENCMIKSQPTAVGECYQDTSGDWHCTMTDTAAVPQLNQPPLK